MNLRTQLQQVAGPVAKLFASLSRLCVAPHPADERVAALEEFLRIVPTRTDAMALLQALGATSWPSTYGESPYEHAAAMLRYALAGHGMPPRSTNAERETHRAFLDVYALPSAVARWDLSRDGMLARYPRLLRAMVHGALLTQGEAQGALHILLRTHPDARERSCPGSEAVAHFGGNVAAVRAARRWRARFASTARQACAA